MPQNYAISLILTTTLIDTFMSSIYNCFYNISLFTNFVINQPFKKMKKPHIIVSIVITSMLFSCCENKGHEQQSLENITKQELATALTERDELLALVKEISVGLEQIKRLENIMTIANAKPNENKSQKARILSEISNLKERIQQRKDQLQKLEAKLQNSTINNKELKETIEAMRIQIDSQMEEIESIKQQLTAANEQIDALNNTVDSLNTTVSTVTGERDSAQEVSVKLENELNICYYVIANKSDLKKHNIIESGFLRKTKLMKGDFDKSYFVISDKRTLDTLPLGTSNVKILTNHPEASYEITGKDGNKTIRITNPGLFWSLTDYLVIQKD